MDVPDPDVAPSVGAGELRSVASPPLSSPYAGSDHHLHPLRIDLVGGVTVIRVTSAHAEAVGAAHRAVVLSLGDPCRAIVIDLSPLKRPSAPDWLSGLADLSRLAWAWPGIPILVACPNTSVQESLRRPPMLEHLVVLESVQAALTIVAARTPPVSVDLRLAPHPTAPRAARLFVSRTFLDWGFAHSMASTCLIVNELVTNAMIHARTELLLQLSTADNLVRIAVRDGSSDSPHAGRPHPDRPDGRGLQIVDRMSRAWGVLPTQDGGKVVWAVNELPVRQDPTPQGRISTSDATTGTS